MEPNERQAKIQSYGDAYQTLMEGLQRYPRHMWKFKPSGGDWSIHEIVVHIADSEANSYIRCRRFLAEPGQDLMAYDENVWARDLRYHDQSPEDALELFRWLRKKSYDLIRAAPEEVWTRECYHPENGTMTMQDWLEVYERHIPDHLEQMDRVYEKWQKGQKGEPGHK